MPMKLNGGGTQVATVSGQGKIVMSWKRISAEEASKVLVQAIVDNDPALLEAVMATPDELTALGVPAAEVQRAAASAKDPSGRVGRGGSAKGLVGWDQGDRLASASTSRCRHPRRRHARAQGRP